MQEAVRLCAARRAPGAWRPGCPASRWSWRRCRGPAGSGPAEAPPRRWPVEPTMRIRRRRRGGREAPRAGGRRGDGGGLDGPLRRPAAARRRDRRPVVVAQVEFPNPLASGQALIKLTADRPVAVPPPIGVRVARRLAGGRRQPRRPVGGRRDRPPVAAGRRRLGRSPRRRLGSREPPVIAVGSARRSRFRRRRGRGRGAPGSSSRARRSRIEPRRQVRQGSRSGRTRVGSDQGSSRGRLVRGAPVRREDPGQSRSFYSGAGGFMTTTQEV